MSITTTPAQSLANEPITLAEAKQQLRIYHNLDDTEITRHIYAARLEAEHMCLRTLRLSVAREQTYKDWPVCLLFDDPPLIAVDSITYYDADNVEQTLAASNYIVRTPTEGRGDLYWTSTAVLPSQFNRIDAIKVSYRTGYVTADAVPESAKHAVLLLVNANYDASELQEAEAYRATAKRILDQLDWGNYE